MIKFSYITFKIFTYSRFNSWTPFCPADLFVYFSAKPPSFNTIALKYILIMKMPKFPFSFSKLLWLFLSICSFL